MTRGNHYLSFVNYLNDITINDQIEQN